MDPPEERIAFAPAFAGMRADRTAGWDELRASQVAYLSKADRRLLYWGEGSAILKMFNQMNLAAALERAGEREKSEDMLARVRDVNPRFAEAYEAISAEIGS